MNNQIKPICLNSKGGRNGVEGLQPSLHNRIYDSNGIATACTTSQFFMPNYTAVAMRGRYNENGEVKQQVEISNREVANAITTVQKDSMVMKNLKIRKLTPKECWRLMGFTDEDFAKAESVCSNTQLYKQAGNSIVVPVLEGIFRNLHSCGVI